MQEATRLSWHGSGDGGQAWGSSPFIHVSGGHGHLIFSRVYDHSSLTWHQQTQNPYLARERRRGGERWRWGEARDTEPQEAGQGSSSLGGNNGRPLAVKKAGIARKMERLVEKKPGLRKEEVSRKNASLRKENVPEGKGPSGKPHDLGLSPSSPLPFARFGTCPANPD